MHTVRKTNEQIIWEVKHLLRQLNFFAKSHNESKKCIITAIDQWTLSRIHRQLEGPTNPKGAYHYPPWSGDSNSTIRVVQKSLVFANTLANLKMATLNYIFRLLGADNINGRSANFFLTKLNGFYTQTPQK